MGKSSLFNAWLQMRDPGYMLPDDLISASERWERHIALAGEG